MSIIKRIICLGVGVFLLFFEKDIVFKIVGGFLLFWFIIDVLGDKYQRFVLIRNIIGIVVGIVLIAYGVILAILYSEWGALAFSALGIIILFQYLLFVLEGKKARLEESKRPIKDDLII